MTVRGALTVVGQGVGYYLGGSWGAAIGSYIGSQVGLAIEGPQQVQGPRLDDLKLTGSSYGTPIAYIEGHPRVAGTIIWASAKREIATTTEVGGKGGAEAEQTTYSYEIDVLILLSANQIAGIRRVWSNSRLAWSVFDQAAATNSTSVPDWAEMIVYTGEAAQLPDPTYEAAVGVGNAPAYRGRGTVLLRGLNLGGSGQLPNLTFEVFTSGTPSVPGFVERFEEGLTGYTAVSGDLAHFEISPPLLETPDYGAQIRIQNFASGTPDSIRKYLPEPITVSDFRCKFYFLGTTGTDDAGEISVGNGSTSLFFIPRREAFFDALQRPLIGINGVNTALGSGPLNPTFDPTWYQLHVSIVPGAGNTTVTITRILDGAVIISQALAGSYTPLTVDQVAFYMDSPPNGVPVAYADVRLPAAPAAVTDEVLPDVVERLCLRAGLAAPQFDVSLLPADVVLGFPIGQISTTRQALDVLAAAHLFEPVESGAAIKFVPRGGASVATLSYAALGATTGNPPEPLPITRRNDDETPAVCVVRYANADNDYQDGSESSDRLIGAGTGVRVVEVPLALTASAAKRLADVFIHDASTADLQFGPVAVSRDYAALEPTDVVTLTDVDGSTYRARLLKLTEGGGVRSFEAILDDASVLGSTGTTAAGYASSTAIAAAVDTLLELMDIPILRDADDAAGLYAAAKGNGTPYPGSRLFGGLDGISYTEIVAFTESAVMGDCTTALGNYTGTNKFDWGNSVTVNVGSGLLASDTYENLLTLETNAALIGNNEIIQFMNATLVSAGVYTLTGLLRGRRGTEWAMTGHAAGERFVLLQLAGLRRVAQSTSEIGSERHYKAVTLGRALGTAVDYPFTSQAVGLKPYAPVDLRGSRDASANLTITWSRRTRLAKNFTDGTVPLGEASESYQVDVFSSNTYTTLKRTISVTAASASYTAAEQTTDFGSAQATVYVRVYQMSATVGRGTKLEGGV